MPPSTYDVNWLSPIHTDDKVNSRQNRRHSRQWTLSLLFESRLSPAHLTLSTMSWSTLSPKLNMFNSVDFVKVGNFCRPNVERRFDFVSSVYRVKETRRPCRIRLCLQCVQGQRNTSTMSNSTLSPVCTGSKKHVDHVEFDCRQCVPGFKVSFMLPSTL